METHTPRVNEVREFLEITMDFSNPLDLVREAISNSFDANAKRMSLFFSIFSENENETLKIEICDNGDGMDETELKSFFDLGNSTRKNEINKKSIGEKGHGTKCYFNSNKVEVFSNKNGKNYHAVMDEPKKELCNGRLPKVKFDSETSWTEPGTKIVIYGYNDNKRNKFNQKQLRDYIKWFTKIGSVEQQFNIDDNKDFKLFLKGLDVDELEEIEFGHKFAEENADFDKLLEQYKGDADKYYCKKFCEIRHLPNYPEIEIQIVFYIEGNQLRYAYNKMIRRSGTVPTEGMYTIQERYGLWLCKDYIPIQRANEWITSKGTEYTRFHAFVNCQKFNLTANRGSVDNTPIEILDDIENVVRGFYEEITNTDEWAELIRLQAVSSGFQTVEKEREDLKKRSKKLDSAKIAKYSINGKNPIILLEPKQEIEVFALFIQLVTYDNLFLPFTILDYNSHSGIDAIAIYNGEKFDKENLFYVEFKLTLGYEFNHSFESLKYIVCWDFCLNDNDKVVDITENELKFKIGRRLAEGELTKYSLTGNKKIIKIIALKELLTEKGIIFTERKQNEVI